jgi:hypothetical protein
MDFAQFKAHVKNFPFFRSNIFTHFEKNTGFLRRQVSEWVNKGYLLQLKRGVYTLREEDRHQLFSPYFLANQLYTPSYISLESALSYYGFIPERVQAITSITSKKTQQFTNALGNFTYRHLKPELFEDFIAKKDEYNQTFLMASPERSIIDFLYFKSRELKHIHEDVFEISFRFQYLERLNKQKLKSIAKKFEHKKLSLFTELFLKYLKES